MFIEDLLTLDPHSYKIPKAPTNALHGVDLLSRDSMFSMSARFIDTMLAFQDAGIPTGIHVAWHYTRSDNLDFIRRSGLLTHADRAAARAAARAVDLAAGGPQLQWTGAVFGPGIYVANNPFAFMNNYGGVLLACLVLPGNQLDVKEYGEEEGERIPLNINTRVGNKQTDNRMPVSGHRHNEYVLASSGQVLPILIVETNGLRGRVDAINYYLKNLVRVHFPEGRGAHESSHDFFAVRAKATTTTRSWYDRWFTPTMIGGARQPTWPVSWFPEWHD